MAGSSVQSLSPDKPLSRHRHTVETLAETLRRPGEGLVVLDPPAHAGWRAATVAPVLDAPRLGADLDDLPRTPDSPRWIACATYDHGARLNGVTPRERPGDPDVGTVAAPLGAWVTVDPRSGALTIEGPDDAAVATIERRLAHPRRVVGHAPTFGALTARTSRADYEDAVREAQRAIRAGETYQVNLSLRLQAEAGGDPWHTYRTLRRANPSPYNAYVEFGPGLPTLVSNSPELLVRVERDHVVTRPIAGTRPRGATPAEDAALEAELVAHAKERAEHVMLVDLARNDLGRVCRYGSVRVGGEAVVERYSHVMHLVSQVTGRLAPDASDIDALHSTFPAGTITGAPKVRTMQIIDELEPVGRGPYTGTLADVGPHGIDSSILIRTLVFHEGLATAQVGAGIVADSVPRAEHAECLDKARALLGAMGVAA